MGHPSCGIAALKEMPGSDTFKTCSTPSKEETLQAFRRSGKVGQVMKSITENVCSRRVPVRGQKHSQTTFAENHFLTCERLKRESCFQGPRLVEPSGGAGVGGCRWV
jgi:hypothetical protein